MELIGKKVQASLWGYVPSFDGEDVDKDYDGDVIGTVESVRANLVRIKVEQYRPNVGGTEFTNDLSKIGSFFIGAPCHYENGYLEEWDYNLKILN